MKKVTKSDLGLNYANLPEEQRIFMEKNADTIVEIVNKALEGAMSKEDVETQFKNLNETLKGVDGDKFAQVIKDNEELCGQVKNLGESFEKLKRAGISMGMINKFDEKLNEMLDSDRFREFAEGQSRKSGKFDGFKLKDIVSMTDNYTGDIHITQQQRTVVSQVFPKKLHIRDVVTNLQGDPEYPNLSFQQIYDVDRNARYVTENGRLPESAVSVKEVTTQTKRLGTHIPISKRMLKSRVFLRSYILNSLPEAVYMAEDWNMLFGNGNGENLLGITQHAGVQSIESILSSAIVSGSAGSIDSVTSADGGAVVTFKNPQPLILDGMNITLAGATTNTGLNATFPVVKMNDRQILLVGYTFSSAETTVSAMSFSVTNAAYKSIYSPNSEDVVNTAFAVMDFAQYSSNAIVLNPLTVNAIGSEKDTTGRNLDIVKVGANGIKMIGNRPVVEYSGMPMGKYLIGDFAQACALVDYTNISLEWAEDVNTKLTNTIELICQEEVIFPVYMPWAFAYGDLAALKTAITKN